MRIAWTLTLTALLALACGGDPAPIPDLPPTPTELVAPPTPPTAPVAAAPPEVVDRYLADCHAVIPVKVDPESPMETYGDAANECLFLELDQNCNPDISGCYNKATECQVACGPTCDGCQGSCATTCDTCKAGCNGDATCLRGCAEARASCRGGCLAAKETCRTTGCSTVESTCEAAWEKERDAKCGPCAPIATCLQAGWEKQDYEGKACRASMPAVPEVCWGWCTPGF